MPRPIRPWLRVYVEMCRDPKLRRLTPERRWIWVAILCAARESHEPGALFVAPGMPMSTKELADFAGVKEREVKASLPLMESLSMLVVEESGLVRVLNWSQRQFESDDVTKRTRDHRERSQEQRRNVPGNGPETETETETDSPTVRSAAKRAAQLPDDWQPSEAHAKLAADRGVDLIEEADKFRDWCASNGAAKKDWEATFRNWLRNARVNGNVRPLRPQTDDQGRVVLPPLPSKSPWGPA